jgi:hypothetical protein
MERGCSSWGAENFGADWIVVQFDMMGKPFNCWILEGKSVTNEPASDGIYWTDVSGNLVHISGWYNRVQVNNGSWAKAAKSLGVDRNLCKGGKYTEKSNE